jgi:hypothetical protein
MTLKAKILIPLGIFLWILFACLQYEGYHFGQLGFMLMLITFTFLKSGDFEVEEIEEVKEIEEDDDFGSDYSILKSAGLKF